MTNATGQVATGYLRGTGAAINVELGWIPDWVRIVNLTDGDDIWENWLRKVAVFSSGSNEVFAGDTLVSNDNAAASFVIDEVILDTGSWAGGDAAGWLILRAGSQVGTWGASDTAYRKGEEAAATDSLTVALPDQDGIDIDTEVAATTTAATNIAEYQGSSGSASRGFTVGATISEDAKLLGYVAVRGACKVNNSA